MKDLEFNSDTETYTPMIRLLKNYKDDINTECKRRKLGKARRLKITRMRNVISKNIVPIRVIKCQKPKKLNIKRPYSSYHGSVHNVENNLRPKNHNDSASERYTWHDAVSNCRSLNNFESENIEAISFGSKKKSIDEIASQIRKLHF